MSPSVLLTSEAPSPHRPRAFVGWILASLLASAGNAHAEANTDLISITPVAPDNAFVFSPKADVAVQFKLANKGERPLSATLSVTTFAGKAVAGPAEGNVKAKGEATLIFRLGKLAADFYRMNLTVSHEGKALHQASFPLAVFEKPKHSGKRPVLPIGVYVNGVKHLQGRSNVYLNTYVHAMAQDIRKHHFNTVVVGASFGPEQIAIFGDHGLSVLVQSPTSDLLGLDPVIGGILAEDPRADDVVPLMEKHKTLSGKTKKPLMICVSGDLAGTKSPQNPMRIWDTTWAALKKGAGSVEEMEPHVRRYWHYYPIEYGPSYPILQSHVYGGCLSFMDSLQQACSGLTYLAPLTKETEKAEAKDGKPEKKPVKKHPEREYFGQIPVWVKLQAFGTTRAQSVYKIPTPAQLQTMMHLSLAFGAKGMMLNCYQTDQPGHSGMVDPVSLQPIDGRLAAAGQVAKQALAHAELLASARYGGGGVMYTNAFAAPVSISTGSKEEDNLAQYVYVINLNTRAQISTWLYGLPRVMRDVTTDQKLKTEMYETRESSWWGLFMTLKPGQARILEKVDLLPTVHQ